MNEQERTNGPRAGVDEIPAPQDPAAEVVNEEVVEDAEVVEEEADSLEDAEVVSETGSLEDAPAGAGEAAPPTDPLADALRERDSYLELAQRARADFENYRRRATAQTAESERRGKAALAKGMLPALDNLERALSAAGVETGVVVDPAGEPPSEEVSARDALAAGVALVLSELRLALVRSGVISYDPVGERFDPLLHEAISTRQADGIASGTVLETLERGYRVDEQVIRPARVVVAG